MTYDEIKAEMQALVREMMEKGVKEPRATATLGSRNDDVALWCAMDAKQFYGEYLRTFHTGHVANCISAARAFIAALPDPATEGERKFTPALADAVDIATEYALPDDLVAPVKVVIAQVNDMLALPKA